MVCAACFSAIVPSQQPHRWERSSFLEVCPITCTIYWLQDRLARIQLRHLFLVCSVQLVQHSGYRCELPSPFFLLTVLCEVLLGAILGLLVGQSACHRFTYAHRKGMIHRPAFLWSVFRPCRFRSGFGNTLGLNAVLAFCAGYAFDRNDWFQDRCEDPCCKHQLPPLILFFVFPWRFRSLGLAVGTLPLFFFRRIPIILLFICKRHAYSFKVCSGSQLARRNVCGSILCLHPWTNQTNSDALSIHGKPNDIN